MIATRPDIAFSICKHSQYNSFHDSSHSTTAKYVSKYLQGTTEVALKLSPISQEVSCYVDADSAGDLDTRKFTSSCLVLLGGSLIVRIFKKQPTVATPTAEAEY